MRDQRPPHMGHPCAHLPYQISLITCDRFWGGICGVVFLLGTLKADVCRPQRKHCIQFQEFNLVFYCKFFNNCLKNQVYTIATCKLRLWRQTLCHTPCDGGFHWEVITSLRDPSRVVKLPSPTAVWSPKAASCSTRRRFRGHNSMGLGSRFSASYLLSKKVDPGPLASMRRFQSSAGGCNSSSRMSSPAASAPRGRGKFCHDQKYKNLLTNFSTYNSIRNYCSISSTQNSKLQRSPRLFLKIAWNKLWREMDLHVRTERGFHNLRSNSKLAINEVKP